MRPIAPHVALSLADCVRPWAQRSPERIAVRHGARTLNFAELVDRIDRIGNRERGSLANICIDVVAVSAVSANQRMYGARKRGHARLARRRIHPLTAARKHTALILNIGRVIQCLIAREDRG